MKLDDTLAIAALLELKRQGYEPKRDIILNFRATRKPTMKTSAIIAKQLSNAELVLNIDGAGGLLDQDGKPEYLTWQGAEKTYADFELTVTNPGGHSSAPREDNAITQLAAGLVKIGAYQFKPELNEITRGYFTEAARYEEPETAAAMRDFVADPTNTRAIALLRANPSLVGRIGTTCVTTMVSGGHAQNALPQRATANINCRIFPGHPPAQIMAELQTVAADPAIQFKDVSVGSVMTDASPIRQDLVAAVTKAIRLSYPGVPVFPSMSAGASDSMWFRTRTYRAMASAPCSSRRPIASAMGSTSAHRSRTSRPRSTIFYLYSRIYRNENDAETYPALRCRHVARLRCKRRPLDRLHRSGGRPSHRRFWRHAD